VRSLGKGWHSNVNREQQPAVAQDTVTGYRPIKLVVAMPTSMVYAIDTIVAEMTIFSIFGSLIHRNKL
jgi:hypothetical protein